MAHKGCKCGSNISDCDGHVVYDVFSKKELVDYMENGRENYRITDMFGLENDDDYIGDNDYFWLCDNCKRIHLWSTKPKECFRIFKRKSNIDNVRKEDIFSLPEYFVFNINDYGEFEEKLIKDIIKKYPLNPYKYFVERNYHKIYIYNIEKEIIEFVYILEYEDYNKYSVDYKDIDGKLVININKLTDEPVINYDEET